VNGVTTKYLVEDDVNPTGYPQVLDELTSGAVTRTYTYGLQRISQDQIINGVWTPSFYGYDGGGNVRQLTNSAGTVTDTYEYDAFGNDVYHTGTTPNNYLYRGEQYDSDLALYYLRARYYNPTTGRFMSRDAEDGVPTDPASLHKYIYAGGDPLGAIDPTGREALFQYAVKIIRKYGPQLTLLANCGRAIYSIYQLIGTALGGGVSELKFIYEYFKQVYSCAGPLAVKLFSMY
jgi:RHS repeat-associated protein